MANKLLTVCSGIVLFLCFLDVRASPTRVNISSGNVSDLLIQSALDYLNDNSSTGHTYKSGSLISAQKWLEPPHVIYRLTLNLEPNGSPNDGTTSSWETCTIDLRQHEGGVIDVKMNSIQCVNLHPQSVQEDVQHRVQEVFVQESSSAQELVDTVDRLVVNESVQLDHEVQTVTDDVERPFIAVRANDRNWCAGCPYELDPTLAGLAAFGEQVVRSMDDSGRSDIKHKVVTIVRVTRAVPPGSNVVRYELLLEIGVSNCSRVTNVPNKLCLVVFEERPWRLNSRKIIRNNCTDVPSTENELDGSTEPRVASEFPSSLESRYEQSTTLGAESSSKPEIYNQVAEESTLGSSGSSIDEILEVAEPSATTGSRDENARIPITEEPRTTIALRTGELETENVGFSDKMKEFDAFLEDFDLKIKPRDPPTVDHRDPVTEELIIPEVVVRPSARKNASDRLMRSKRSLVDTPENEISLVVELAKNALSTLDDIDTDNKKRKILGLIDSKREETFDGTVYHVTMKVVATECDETNVKPEECFDDPPGPAKICRVQIHTEDKRPVESAKVLQSQCFPEPSRRRETRVRRSQHLVGGATAKRTDDPEIISYARMGVEKFSKSSDSPNEPFLIEIIEASAQVVSGMLYKIKVRLGESTCPKGRSDDCQLRSGSPIRDFLIRVWSQPWIDHGNPEIQVKEETTRSDRSKRESLSLGSTKLSTDDERVRNYARRALERYSDESELHYEPLLAKIKEVVVQTVSGKLYNISVVMAESNCSRGLRENCVALANGVTNECFVTVWSQPWKDHGVPEIKIKCDDENRSRRSLRGANYSAKMLKLRKNIELEKRFDEFMEKFDVSYPTEEEKTARFRVFKDNMKIIDELRRGEQGSAEYGVTMFADLTPEEFRTRYTGLKPKMRQENDLPLPVAEIPDIELPDEFDWRHHNIVTEVKNQGSCGSCWAFAVTGNVEGLYALKHGKLLSLSEQELVDCDTFDSGCNGGLPDNAYRAIETLGGLELETDYPYEGEDEKCHFDKDKARVAITSGLNITSNETGMAQWLVKNGPISIGINANAMQFYMGGVSHPFKFLCNKDNLDHGVLIVGYGIHKYPIFKKSMPYWIIKNSWGRRWGEQGYYRVYRGDGTCGLNTMATSAVVV